MTAPVEATNDDLTLLEAWRAGDMGAGETLFERHINKVHRFFKNKVAKRDDVEDLVQRTFMACVEARDRKRDGSTFRAYLFGIAHNMLRVYYRKRGRARERFDYGSVSVAGMDIGAFTAIGEREEHRLLLAALREIPVEYQTVLELHYWERMTTGEIAQVTGVPPGTARSRLRRARQLVERELARLAASPGILESTVQNLDGWAAQIREML